MKTNFHGAALASKIVAEEWAEDFADLLTCYNSDKVNKGLFGHFATRKREDEAIRYDELCAAFLHLKDSGVLVQEFHSDIADEQLEQMRALVVKANAPKPIPPPTPEELQNRAIDDCVADFKTLSSSAFKAKWLGVRRSVYEAAFQAGRI